jgi:ABC-type branched-subunit amino acid transport system substrate-binding protein
VTGLAAEAIWSSHRNMFTVSNRFTDDPSVTTYGRYAKAQGGTRAFLLQGSTNPSYESIGAQFQASLAAAGIPVVAQAEYIDSVTSTAALAADIRASNADVIAGATSSPGLASVLQAVRAAGVHPKVVFGPDGYNPSLLTEFGSAIAGMSTYTTVTPSELNSPTVERYRAAMERYAPELSETGRATAIYGYITTDLFLLGLKMAGECPSRAGFIGGLRSVTGYNAGGLLAGKTDFGTTSPTGEACYYFLRVNAAGTGFEVVKSGDSQDGNEWCGTRLPG